MNRNLFIITIIFISIIFIILLGNVFIIGDKLGQIIYDVIGDRFEKPIHHYVEYTFYSILFLLAYTYLIRPMIRVHCSTEIPILSRNEKQDNGQLLNFARQLANNCNYINDEKLRNEHKRKFLESIQLHSANVGKLCELIDTEIEFRIKGNKELKVLGVDNRIKEWGKTVFMVTAVSQNNRFDTLAVLVMNYKLIADIVLASGFRPTKPQMFKLYIKVLTTALVTYCSSKVFTDVDGVAPFDFDSGKATDDLSVDADTDMDVGGGEFETSIMNSLKKIEIPGVIVGSVMDGCLNALMTLRIGYVTKSYLTGGASALSGTKNKRKVKRNAIKESFKALPSIVAYGGGALKNTASSILAGIFEMHKSDIYNRRKVQLSEDK